MLKRLIFTFCSCVGFLQAAEVPQEEGLHKALLENGIATWVRENRVPAHMASVRVVWSKEGIPVASEQLDCPASDIDDLSLFFEFCKEKMEGSFERAAVIAVGDFAQDDMKSFIADHFNHLYPQAQELSDSPLRIRHVADYTETDVSLAYPAEMESIHNLEDLKKLWCLYFFQGLVQKRFEESLSLSGGEWIPGGETRFLLPQRVCIAKAKAGQMNPLDVLMGFLLSIQEIRKTGFKPSEFLEMKAKVQKHLLSVNHKHPSSGILASYYADWFVFGSESPAYSFFVQNSQNLLHDLTLDDMYELVETFLKDDHRIVELVVPMGYDIEVAQVQETLKLGEADTYVLDRSAISPVDNPVAPDAPNPYALLPIAEDDVGTIWKIIDTVAKTNPIKLAFKKADLDKKRQKIEYVHPLKFLGTIFSDPHLKKCMGDIEDSYFKWSNFVSNLGDRMNLEYSRNNLLPYVAGFSQTVKANPDKVKEFILKRDWEGLLRYLL